MTRARKEKECCIYSGSSGYEGRDAAARQIASTFKAGAIGYVLYLAVFGTINYLVGQGIGGPKLAEKYAGYFLANGAVLVAFAVPGVGTAVALLYGNISSQFEAILGITSNYWIDTWVSAVTLVIGVVVQTVSVAYVVMKLYYWWIDQKVLLPGVQSR